MKYEVKTSQFCALARDPQWQHWLGSVASDLSTDLLQHIKLGKSCSSNKEKMLTIYKQLISRKLGNKLLKFLRAFYPTVLRPLSNKNQKKIRKIEPTLKHDEYKDLNKHDIFKIFKPHILSFPHKYIIIDEDPNNLLLRIRKFIRTKISVDYIIIDDRAYIEYFEPKYEDESNKINQSQREIYQYKKKNGINI